jgi:hypothetical protein
MIRVLEEKVRVLELLKVPSAAAPENRSGDQEDSVIQYPSSPGEEEEQPNTFNANGTPDQHRQVTATS